MALKEAIAYKHLAYNTALHVGKGFSPRDERQIFERTERYFDLGEIAMLEDGYMSEKAIRECLSEMQASKLFPELFKVIHIRDVEDRVALALTEDFS